METRTFEYRGERFRVYIGSSAELFLDAGDLEKIVSIIRNISRNGKTTLAKQFAPVRKKRSFPSIIP